MQGFKATVTNYGRSQHFPTCIGNLYLECNRVHDDIVNRQALEELSKWPFVDVEIIEGSFGNPAIDYSYFGINALRKMAAQAGIKDGFTMKKSLLIKKMEEKDGISTC